MRFKQYLEEVTSQLKWNQFIVNRSDIKVVEKYLKFKKIVYELRNRHAISRIEVKDCLKAILFKTLKEFRNNNIEIVEDNISNEI